MPISGKDPSSEVHNTAVASKRGGLVGQAIRANARRAGYVKLRRGFKLFPCLFMSLLEDPSSLHVKEFATALYSLIYLP